MTAVSRAKPGVAGPITALGILAELGVLGAVLDADDARAYFLGHPVPFVCAVRARTGVPCPMCGATRAVAFTLRGDFEHALRLNPIGPIAVLGLVAVAVALLAGAVTTAVAGAKTGARFRVTLRRATLVYAAVGATVWLAAFVGHAAEALAVR